MAGNRRRFTLEEYRRMGETGILGGDDRVELVAGDIVEMSPIGSRHAATVARMHHVFSTRLGSRAVIWSQNPLLLSRHESELRPDLLVLAPRDDFYAARLPEPADVWLLIEVADSSLLYDRGTKFRLYARAGLAEVWLANVDAGRIELHQRRGRARYRSVRAPNEHETFSPAAFPDLTLKLRDLFG